MDPRTAQLPANRNKPKPRFENLCPYGCTEEKGFNEHGYCRHLIGWSYGKEPGSTIELREKHGTTGQHERCGVKTDTIQANDVVVEMATPTCRVYRGGEGERPTGQQRRPQLAQDQQVDALLATLAEQAEQIKRMNQEAAERDKAWEKRFNEMTSANSSVPAGASKPAKSFPAPPG